MGLLHTLATLPTHPESVPINALVPVKGTPLQDQKVQFKEIITVLAKSVPFYFDTNSIIFLKRWCN